jgi:predicted O-linked N-acetylglucosamine transferase (SPINDLY family)
MAMEHPNAKPLGGFGSLCRAVALCLFLLAAILQECVGQQQMQQEFAKLRKEMKENPRDSLARYKLAWTLIRAGKMNDKTTALLKSAFNPNKVENPIQEHFPIKALLGAQLLARYTQEEKDYLTVQKYLKIAYETSRQLSPSQQVGEICTHMMLATSLTTYPLTNEEVDESVAKMEFWATLLIDLMAVQKHPDAYLNVQWLASQMPGFAQDPYNHCILTLFPLSFMYRADAAKIANLFYQITALAFPKLLYTAPHVEAFDERQKQLQLSAGTTTDPDDGSSPPKLIQECVDRKIKLGIVCSTLSESHSVSEDFGGILTRLDRNIFDVSYHFVHENTVPEMSAKFLSANPSDTLYHYLKGQPEDAGDGAWPRRISAEIEKFELDMIFFPDLTMGGITRRIGMGRLAPVQINSHGHPMTSGMPRDTIQHFVSWAEAELDLEDSQTHYTEELQLIPKGKIHQYYTPRVLTGPKGNRYTRVSNMPFDQFTRNNFGELSPELRKTSPETDPDVHLYVCMQKPFKLFPEFDELVCGVLQRDPQGHAILHKETKTGNTDIFIERLTKAGCPMDRVHFVSPQPSHLLMALYKTATVILDSYPAGGCTTSREALELGKAIVTRPARLLGGRWTLGLYNTIGLDGDAMDRVVANSAEDYIAKAVELGTNPSLRTNVEAKILEALPNLFGREDAVEEWEKILVRISPVKQCIEPDSSGADEL